MAEAETGKGRLVQFELLRILAMFGVVMNHVFNDGLDIYGDFRVEASSFAGFLLWSALELMKLMALPSVNCYVLITGYFLIDRTELRLKGIWKVWSTTWFYAVGIYLLAALLGFVPFEGNELLKHATPVLSNSYWFVTSYLALLLLAPIVSWLLQRASKRQYEWALVIGGIVCFQPLLGWLVMDHQQILLFVYLFMIGGYIHRYADKALSMPQAIMAYIVTMVVMFAYILYKNHPNENSLFTIHAMAYHGLVLPLSFAVYIIHTQSNVNAWLWGEAFQWFTNCNPYLLPLACIAFTLAVFVVCVIVDHIKGLFLR